MGGDKKVPPRYLGCSHPSDAANFSCPPPGCLAEQWSGKKGDTATLGGKKAKKKGSQAKTTSGSSQQRKELRGVEGDPGAEDEEEGGIQKASPLPHSPPDEL